MSTKPRKRGPVSTMVVVSGSKRAVATPPPDPRLVGAGRRCGRCPKCGDGFAGPSGFCFDCGG